MNLRLCTLAIVGFTLIALFLVLFIASDRIFLEGFSQLEAQHLRGNTDLIKLLLDQKLKVIEVEVRDYGQWDDTYHFMTEDNPDYYISTLSAANLKRLDLNIIALFHSDGSLRYGGKRMADDPQLTPIPADVLQVFQEDQRLQEIMDNQVVTSIISTAYAPLLIAATPIVPHAANAPARGLIVMGRYLDATYLEQLSLLSGVKLTFLVADAPEIKELQRKQASANNLLIVDKVVSVPNPQPLQYTNTQWIYGYSPLFDGHPYLIGWLRTQAPRWIYQQGIVSRQYLLINLVVMGVVCIGLILLILEHLILSRLSHFDRVVSRITETQNPHLRLPVHQSDELDRLANTINQMLDTVADNQKQLLFDALHDPLTGLANRLLLMERIQQAIQQASRRSDQIFAVLLLDLDRFKLINDSLGHGAGDQLLLTVAQRLESGLRRSDTVARLGGDEFAMLMMLPDPDAIIAAVERLRQQVLQPVSWQQREMSVSTSIGIAIYKPDYETAEQMVRDADIAMYRAKQQGRNGYALFDQMMHAQVMARLELENDLKHALERGELIVYYQPILSLAEGIITGFEALLRWQSPQRGLLTPGAFMEVAHDIGLMIEIDQWVITKVCDTVRRFQQQKPHLSPFTISINIASKQFPQADFVHFMRDTLATTGIAASSLLLEITESVLLDADEAVYQGLELLHTMGIRLCLDDFGTGYSSLHRLHRLPIDMLKIDGCFVNSMPTGDVVIAQAIVQLAHHLGKKVVAEGVETAAQAEALRTMGCDFGQGYYFAAPQPLSEAGFSQQTSLLNVH